jgi:hypothetical protein
MVEDDLQLAVGIIENGIRCLCGLLNATVFIILRDPDKSSPPSLLSSDQKSGDIFEWKNHHAFRNLTSVRESTPALK